MSQYDLHVLCVAAYNMLGVPPDVHQMPLGNKLFALGDVGSVFWVGVGDVYVRGGKRPVASIQSLCMPPGTIGVVTGVYEGVRSVASVVHLNTCRGKISIVANPTVVV